MLDGLLPETCAIVVDKITVSRFGDRADGSDLIEYGCDGPNRRELRRQRIDRFAGQYGMERWRLDLLIDAVNKGLRRKRGCTCT